MAVAREIAGVFGVAAVLLGVGHVRAGNTEDRVMASCENTAACTCVIDNLNAEIGMLGRAASSAPLLQHVFTLVYDPDKELAQQIAAECGAPTLFGSAGRKERYV